VSKLEKHANTLVLQLGLAGMAHSEQKASGDLMALASKSLEIQSIRIRFEEERDLLTSSLSCSIATEWTWR
jgi:hypothetical protein